MHRSQPLAPGQMPAPRTLGVWLWDNAGRIAPGLTTSTVLALARIWNDNGAHHSTGDAALMIALSAGCAAVGTVTAMGEHGDSLTSAVAYTASGALAVVAVSAYSSGLALPLILWVLATCAVYALAARYWRQEKRERLAAERTYSLRHMERRYDLMEKDRDVEIAVHQAEAARQEEYAHQLAAAVLQRQQLDSATAATLDEIRNKAAAARERSHLRVVGE